MKFMAVLACAAAALAPMATAVAQTPAPEPAEILILPEGTAIELMVLREVDSDRAKPGDPVKLRVNSPVKIGELVVIPAGAAAQGEVVATKESGALLRRGKVSVEIASLTVAGETIPLATSLEQKARGGKNDDLWKTVLAPHLLLFARGNSAKLKAGELLSAELESSICFGPGGDGYRPVPCPADAVTTEADPDAA